MTLLSPAPSLSAPARPTALDADGVRAVELSKDYPRPTAFFSVLARRARGTVRAVDRVSLHLRPGEVFGLVGPNGAGKTTLIKMLTTLLVPTSGQAWIAGHDTRRAAARVRGLVGLVTSNERSFYWRLTARQNLEFFARLYHLPRREARRWIDELLALVGLAEAADRRFDGFSTGMKQRLALARGLLSRPPFLFMDEPTKGVDPLGAAEIIDMIRGRIIETWKPTILITSHNLSEVERLCRRVALMHHGRIIHCGELEDLRRLARPADVYRLSIRNLAPAVLVRLAHSAGAAADPRIHSVNGSVELEVSFAQQGGGFARLIRTTVEAGGDVLTCTSVQESFEDVFQKLVRHADPAAAQPPTGEP